ncbi:hypothetical protein RHGRI_003624 [Rhododendron griersonianum]|uniref:Uncharacterized protein n=1 Tax=Rhododendron griersonianum TaxID=479676 RepID=A0AAV6L6R0_9ERIC|nr:hypothetical protein RHGRI_003624 [Rhododendron griersonianum]
MSGGADEGLEEDIPGGYKSEEVTELDAEVGKGPAAGELGVAEDGEEGGEAGDSVGEGDDGAGLVVGFPVGDDQYAGADDGAEGEPGEVAPGEAAVHGVLAVGSEGGELGGVGGAGG